MELQTAFARWPHHHSWMNKRNGCFIGKELGWGLIGWESDCWFFFSRVWAGEWIKLGKGGIKDRPCSIFLFCHPWLFLVRHPFFFTSWHYILLYPFFYLWWTSFIFFAIKRTLRLVFSSHPFSLFLHRCDHSLITESQYPIQPLLLTFFFLIRLISKFYFIHFDPSWQKSHPTRSLAYHILSTLGTPFFSFLLLFVHARITIFPIVAAAPTFLLFYLSRICTYNQTHKNNFSFFNSPHFWVFFFFYFQKKKLVYM